MAHFTEQEIEEIRRRLSRKAVKDTEFPETDTLNTEDCVAIVQGGTNKRISVDAFRSELQNGPKGEKGDSAYDVAVKHGYKGTEDEWYEKWLGGLLTLHLTETEYNAQRDAYTLDSTTWYMVYSDAAKTRLIKVYIGYVLFAQRAETGSIGFDYTFPIVF